MRPLIVGVPHVLVEDSLKVAAPPDQHPEEVVKPASTDLTEGAVLNRLHIDPQPLTISPVPRWVCVDGWLLQPVLVILVSMLDQRHGGHLLVLDQIGRPDLNGLSLAPRGEDHPFMLEHLLVEVERCAQQ